MVVLNLLIRIYGHFWSLAVPLKLFHRKRSRLRKFKFFISTSNTIQCWQSSKTFLQLNNFLLLGFWVDEVFRFRMQAYCLLVLDPVVIISQLCSTYRGTLLTQFHWCLFIYHSCYAHSVALKYPLWLIALAIIAGQSIDKPKYSFEKISTAWPFMSLWWTRFL